MDPAEFLEGGAVGVSDETYAVCRTDGDHPDAFATVREANETTVVIEQGRMDAVEADAVEPGWKRLTFEMELPFELVGFLAAVATAARNPTSSKGSSISKVSRFHPGSTASASTASIRPCSITTVVSFASRTVANASGWSPSVRQTAYVSSETPTAPPSRNSAGSMRSAEAGRAKRRARRHHCRRYLPICGSHRLRLGRRLGRGPRRIGTI